MVRIIHGTELENSAEYGFCASCGKQENFRIIFTDSKSSKYVGLCKDCIFCLGNELLLSLGREMFLNKGNVNKDVKE